MQMNKTDTTGTETMLFAQNTTPVDTNIQQQQTIVIKI